MNYNNLNQIFARYIERFEELNNDVHREYDKWQIIHGFRAKMDFALNGPIEEFSKRLYEVKKISSNLIDNYIQPFYGLVKFAEIEPETVREMFEKLYSDDFGDIIIKQKKVTDFLKSSHMLRAKYFPESYLYKDDVHSVTGYLFLYDPDHNYIFKASHALRFADCIEFYDDWGSGESVKLDVYYRMCDQLVEAIKNDNELLETDASRFSKSLGLKEMHPDSEKHILAFDLIYCCSTYNLFEGISFVRPKSKDRQLMQERKDKALKLSHSLQEAKERLMILDEAIEYLKSAFCDGKTISHKKDGAGIVKNNDGSNVTVVFANQEEKKLGLIISAANDIISIDDNEYRDKMKSYREFLKKETFIRSSVSYAEKELSPYIEFLD